MAIKSADQITIIDVTDAYSVMLTSEAYTFVGDVSGTATGLTCTTQAVAYCGTNRCSTVSVTANNISCPPGISASVSNSGSNAVTITFTTTAAIDEACEATIPVEVDGITINKKFSFAVALKGNTGAAGAAGTSITGVTTYYLASVASSGITTSSNGWTTTIQTTDTSKKYLWSYQKISYSSGNPTTTTPVIIGTHGETGATGAPGETGATGNGVSKVETYYLTTSSASGITTSASGWSTTPTATTTTNKYIWSYQKITYTSGDTTTSSPAIIGTHGETGATGAAGADAITLTVTSSNGTIFKNSSGSTVLTAHVFVGGVEQTITDTGVCGSLGSIKWYKAGSSTAVATAKTYTVSASAVTNSAVYTCQLEG